LLKLKNTKNMAKYEISTLPKFFKDQTHYLVDPDSGYEALQDFFLRWTIHCAEDKYRFSNPKLHIYSKRILFALIYGQNQKDDFVLTEDQGDFKVINIKTLRQLSDIDLIILIEFEKNNQIEKYVLNIENKWYSNLGKDQFTKYKEFIENHDFSKYIKDFKSPKIKNLFITCDDERRYYDAEKNLCRANNYFFLVISDLQKVANICIDGPTGNALFDEFWFNS